MYKSDWSMIQKILRHLIWLRKHPDDTPVPAEFVGFIGAFYTWLSGGSIISAGTTQPNMPNAKKTNPTYRIPKAQSSNSSINNALREAKQRNGVVCVIVDYTQFAKNLFTELLPDIAQTLVGVQKKQKGVVLGYYKLNELSITAATEQEYLDFMNSQPIDLVKQNESYYSYQLVNSDRIELLPLFGTRQYQLLDRLNQQRERESTMTTMAYDTSADVDMDLYEDEDNYLVPLVNEFQFFTVHESDNMPLPFTGLRGVDYRLHDPTPEDLARFYTRQSVWTLFQGERDEYGNLMSDPEMGGVPIKNNSYIIPDITTMIKIVKFVAIGVAIRYERITVLKPHKDLQPNKEYAHPLSDEDSQRLGIALQTVPTPHPSRSYDAPELIGRAQAQITFGTLLRDGERVSMNAITIDHDP
jgi:hypothetical protein